MRRALAGVALLAVTTHVSAAEPAAPPATAPAPSLGVPATAQDVERLSITVFPDGRNLPPGGGDARSGARLYRDQCAPCHGESGTEGPAPRLAGSDGLFALDDPLRVLRILDSPLLVHSLGARWPHATTIFDYVRRAMPHFAPKSLRDDEVYALTAFVLHANGLIEDDVRVDAATLPRIVMPGRARSVAEAGASCGP